MNARDMHNNETAASYVYDSVIDEMRRSAYNTGFKIGRDIASHEIEDEKNVARWGGFVTGLVCGGIFSLVIFVFAFL